MKDFHIHNPKSETVALYRLVSHVTDKNHAELLEELLTFYIEKNPELFTNKVKVEIERTTVLHPEIESLEAKHAIANAEKVLAAGDPRSPLFVSVYKDLERLYHVRTVSTAQKTTIAKLLTALVNLELRPTPKIEEPFLRPVESLGLLSEAYEVLNNTRKVSKERVVVIARGLENYAHRHAASKERAPIIDKIATVLPQLKVLIGEAHAN